MPAQLIAPSGHAVELTALEVVLGSGPDVDIPISAEFGLAPRHFAIKRSARGAHLRVLMPGLPLTVNGSAVESAALQDGDCILAAGLRVVYRAPVDEAISPALEKTALGAFFSPSDLDSPVEPPFEETKPAVEKSVPPATGKDDTQRAAERIMHACLAQSLRDRRGPKDESDFNLAFVTALIATVPACLACIYASRWNVMLSVPALLLVSLGVGYLVRLTGKGAETRFGYVAAAASILAVMGTQLFTTDVQQAARLATSTAPEVQAYAAAGETRAPSLEEPPNPARERPTLFDPSSLDEPDTLAPAVTQTAPVMNEPAPLTGDDTPSDLAAWAWLLLGPKALATYFFVGGIAYFMAIRNAAGSGDKSLRELAMSQVRDTSHLSLRERVVLQHHE